MPNGHFTTFYSIGALREKQADWFREDLTELFDLLVQGRIKPVIAEWMPLTEAARAHGLIEQTAGKPSPLRGNRHPSVEPVVGQRLRGPSRSYLHEENMETQ